MLKIFQKFKSTKTINPEIQETLMLNNNEMDYQYCILSKNCLIF